MAIQIINADVLDGLAQLNDESVQCCVTSPPYWGLRDYGVAGQIGLEAMPELFVARMVEVFREVKRVLRKDGVVFLNLGDSYMASGPRQTGRNDTNRDTPGGRGGSFRGGARSAIACAPAFSHTGGCNCGTSERASGLGTSSRDASVSAYPHLTTKTLKPKDLVGIPWMTAFALRADGWWLRQEIIWNKPNSMPESVRDRCTKSHEHIFLLSKSERYFFDAAAIREGADKGYAGSEFNTGKTAEHQLGRASDKQRIGSKGNAKTFRGGVYTGGKAFQNSGTMERNSTGNAPNEALSRNKRSVWTIATQGYAEAHFATFPEELPETCIKAGSQTGDMILDPFGGAGTTGLVADKLGRNAVLIELNPEYAAMAEKRIIGNCPMFASVSASAQRPGEERQRSDEELPLVMAQPDTNSVLPPSYEVLEALAKARVA